MAVRVRAFNLLRPGLRCLSRNACSFSSNMVVRVTTRNSFSLVHTSAPSASDMAVQVTARNHASNHASKLLFRARLFFGRNRLRVYRIYSGAVCERSQILANGRHILSQVPSNPMFAIRCWQKRACAARRPTIARRAARKNHSILSMMSRSSLIRSRSSRV